MRNNIVPVQDSKNHTVTFSFPFKQSSIRRDASFYISFYVSGNYSGRNLFNSKPFN